MIEQVGTEKKDEETKIIKMNFLTSVIDDFLFSANDRVTRFFLSNLYKGNVHKSCDAISNFLLHFLIVTENHTNPCDFEVVCEE